MLSPMFIVNSFLFFGAFILVSFVVGIRVGLLISMKQVLSCNLRLVCSP